MFSVCALLVFLVLMFLIFFLFFQEKDKSVFSAVIFTVIQDKKNIKAVKRQQISMNFGPD